tara:strand:+ start:21174 stop:21650 length:477 start_codon:yes stop_codon:yes gene_type:complete
MKIYTEINYEWLDGQLVKTSSKSFEYSGNISECKGGGGPVQAIIEPVASVTNAVTQGVTDFVDQNTDSIANSSEIQQLGQNLNPVNAFSMLTNALGIGDGLPGLEDVVPASSKPKDDPSYAKGVGGKAIKNNPFLSIQKGKQFARASSQFRRPTNSLS